MPRSLLPPDTIYGAALELVEEGGIDALNMRNLAARLHCATKTVYRQVGNRQALQRGLIAYAFRLLRLEFTPGLTPTDTVSSFAVTLRSALLASPRLAAIMTIADRDAVIEYARQLVDALTAHGLDEHAAVSVAGIVNHLTLSMTLADIGAPGEWDRPEVFETALRWLTTGILEEYPELN